MTSFTSLAKIEQWDKARHLLSRCPSYTYTQNIVFLTLKNKASATLGLALFMCLLQKIVQEELCLLLVLVRKYKLAFTYFLEA